MKNLPAANNERPLAANHKAFCRAYVITESATQAYMQVYNDVKPECAWASASRLLRKVKVRDEIRRLQNDALERNNITADRIIKEYAALAFSDITDVTDTPIRDLNKLPKYVRAAIKKVNRNETESGYNETVEMHPKQAALDRLAEMAGLIKKDGGIEISGENVQVIFK
jgi:phage terminase small subunit